MTGFFVEINFNKFEYKILMDSIFDFIFNEKKYYTLVALDIIEGIDNNYYVVDINGLVSCWPINQHIKQFEDSINEIFNEEFYFDCSEIISDFGKYKIGSQNRQSKIWISNHGFEHEDKIKWRKLFQINSPNINDDVVIHELNEYPKYLVKPTFGFKSKGIELYNDSSFSEKIMISGHFVEQFIPSKLVDGYCYSIRVYMIINENECYPVLYLQRNCTEPIVENLKKGLLDNHERNSYLSNSTDKNKIFYINKSPELREFVSKIKIYK